MVDKVWQNKTHFRYKIFIPALIKKLFDKREFFSFFYLKKKVSFRGLSKEETDKLFLSLLEPHKLVSVLKISKCIVQTIQLAYETNR